MITDANGVALAYLCGDDRKKDVSYQSLTVDEARRIAAGIARLPELLAKKPAPRPMSELRGDDPTW